MASGGRIWGSIVLARDVVELARADTPRRSSAQSWWGSSAMLWLRSHGLGAVLLTSALVATLNAIRRSSSYQEGWPEFTDPALIPTGVALVIGRALWSGLNFLEVHNPRLRTVRLTTGLLFALLGTAVCRLSPQVGPIRNGPTWTLSVKAFLIAFGLFGLIRIRWTYPVAAGAVVIRAAAAAALLESNKPLVKIALWETDSSRSLLSWSLSIGMAALALGIYAVRGLRWDAE
jgi:hypothetical protein